MLKELDSAWRLKYKIGSISQNFHCYELEEDELLDELDSLHFLLDTFRRFDAGPRRFLLTAFAGAGPPWVLTLFFCFDEFSTSTFPTAGFGLFAIGGERTEARASARAATDT